ncbi:hypothetical protein GQ55_3G435300 [Panicum hallii var. hallii]|uniref:Cytochrome c oxidase subunit 5C n=2 Tax=Paniceae TaxID=147428 RepID=A0A2T7EHZ3_9POAL|nr:hypothetical protein GQ55_3G435300 [Panicum hallii var. hallii]
MVGRRGEPRASQRQATSHSLANTRALKGVSAKTTPLTDRTDSRSSCLSRGGGASPPPSPSPARHLASDLNSKQMAGGRVAHATLKGPSVVKEIFIGLTLGLIAGGMWKMHHWNEQRKTRSFYDMLDKGQISVVVEE